ncbi:MAG TPA: putative Ig domain-containing protein [Terriglobia bacterium]|nr:putative Ig domain-containing protein [Terriglobia bacterium]
MLCGVLRASRIAYFVAGVALAGLFLSGCGGGAPGLLPVPSVIISPSTASPVINQTVQFTASVSGTTNSAVTWSVDGIAGGSATVGTISATGLFTAPGVPPTPNVVTVTASTLAAPVASDSASVTIVYPAPQIASLSFTTIDAGSPETPLVVSGTGFISQSQVMLGTTPLATTFDSSTQLTAAIPAANLASAGTFPVTVQTPAPGGGTSNAVNLTVRVVVVVSPPSANLMVGQTQQFNATVTGSSNQNVTWAVDGVAGGNATVGTIQQGGLYTAPAVPNTVTVAATSVADTGGSGSAAVSVVNPVPSIGSVSPASLVAGAGDTALTVNGSGFAQQSQVTLGGTLLASTYVSPTQLTATVTSSQLATAGAFPLSVVNPAPGGGTSTLNFSINGPPVITSAASAAFTVGAAGSFTVTATGYPAPTLGETGALPSGVTFTAASGVLGGTPGAATAGTYNLSFTASNGVGTAATQSFTLTVDNPAPALYSMSPNAATAGDPGTALAVAGANFTAQSVVYFDATALATVYGSATQLTATIPSSLLASAGTFSITVMTSAPGGGASTSLSFTVWPGYPRPGAGSVLSGPPPPLTPIPHNGTLVSVLDWTAKDNEGDSEDVISADHLVAEMGIPNIDTADFATAAANPFMVVAGVLNTASSLSSTDITNLANYVNGGGTLYLWEPDVSGLLAALGITSPPNDYSNLAQEQRPLTFDTSQNDPILKYINAPEEINWAPFFPVSDVTRGYAGGSCTPLATWSTGDYAVLRCNLGTGRAYVFGWRLRPLLELPELQLGNDTGPQGVNAIVPDADICRLMMRSSYETYAANPQERQWAPGGHHAALIITHDVDATVSYQNVPATVDFETSLGIKSTFLFTANPYGNGWIAGMYDASGHEDIQYALDHGFDVQDHSVGHFPDFDTAPYSLTTPPSETAANYLPMFTLISFNPYCCTSGMSVIGEVGVSKWLLEQDFNIPITTFRAGYTEIPASLLQALAATGYQRDLSYLNDLTRGAFPFATFSLDASTTPTTVNAYPVMEYPMSISDDASPAAGLTGLDTSTVSDYAAAWEKVIKFNYDNNAPTVLLLHPIDITARFQVMQQVITDLKNQGLDLWVGDIATFANFWEAQGVTNAKGW